MINKFKLKKLVSEDLKKAFDELERILELEKVKMNDFWNLKGQYNQIKSNKSQGILTHEEYYKEQNILRKNFLIFIDELVDTMETIVEEVGNDKVESLLTNEIKPSRAINNFNAKVNNVIIGDKNTINVKKNNRKNYPKGSIGFENDKANYISYLVDRFHEFKKFEKKEKMNYAIFLSQLKKRYKIGVTRSIYHVSVKKFEDMVVYIQRRIEQTKLGKIKKGQKKYSTFEEYKLQQSI